ncbi:MAG: NAD-dependent epimerase/dehydratase family protein [Pirellulaceae bacterium]|nr:NAD-dependent epimerase/dehydratase family protein [Pirellulaceae bacterium]
MNNKVILVAGGGGFIGGHLVASLRQRPHVEVRSVDIKPLEEWYQVFPDVENIAADLRNKSDCERACAGVSDVYNLAADMGGMGFIENNKALCMLSVLINTHLLQAATAAGAKRFFYASSACVYNADKQVQYDLAPLKEGDAYPAMPEDGYGWEKLFSERMCRHFQEDFGIQTWVARFHNVYGAHGTWDGGREKAPAAICRKVIEAVANGRHEIKIWGDGRQTRSFTYIDDCIHGIDLLMGSDFHEPLNLGSSEMVSINQLVDIVEGFFGIRLKRHYQLDAPKGVNGRNSDNTLIKSLFDWEPSTSLVHGMRRTCAWIRDEYIARLMKSGSAAQEIDRLRQADLIAAS